MYSNLDAKPPSVNQLSGKPSPGSCRSSSADVKPLSVKPLTVKHFPGPCRPSSEHVTPICMKQLTVAPSPDSCRTSSADVKPLSVKPLTVKPLPSSCRTPNQTELRAVSREVGNEKRKHRLKQTVLVQEPPHFLVTTVLRVWEFRLSAQAYTLLRTRRNSTGRD